MHLKRAKKLMACCLAVMCMHSPLAVTKTFALETNTAIINTQDDDAGRFTYEARRLILSKASATKPSDLIHNPRYAEDYVITDGVDVSKYQTKVDWNAVAADGIEFVLIRLGFRGYAPAGNMALDKYYEQHITAAQDAGLKVGVYFFTQALNTQEAVEEAEFVLKNLEGIELDAPVYLDIETIDFAANGRLDKAKLSKEEHTANCLAFCETIENAGYKAGVYANKEWLNNKLNSEKIAENYEIWLANYTNQATYEGEYQTWQYTSQGTVAGIPGTVDLNVRYSRMVEYAEEAITLTEDLPVMPQLEGDGRIEYISSDPTIASVDAMGNITPLKNGTVMVSAISDNGTTDSLEVTVNAFSEEKLNTDMLCFTNLGEFQQLELLNANGTVNWVSQDQTVAYVTTDGRVKAVDYGMTKVYAMDELGNLFACDVYIVPDGIMAGDCNMNGMIDAMDAASVLSFSVTHAVTEGVALPDKIAEIYDVNSNGVVDALDAGSILLMSADMGTTE